MRYFLRMLIPMMLLAVAPWEGLVTVDTTPKDAEVFVDDERCESPCEAGNLTPGRHAIMVRREGFEHRVVELDTKLNERRFVHVDLFPIQSEDAQLIFAKKLRVTGWALLGVSLATVATSGILQMTLVPQSQERAGSAPNDSLAEQAQRSQLIHRAQQVQMATIGIAIAGGAVLAGAIAILAGGQAPTKKPPPTSMSPSSPSSAPPTRGYPSASKIMGSDPIILSNYWTPEP